MADVADTAGNPGAGRQVRAEAITPPWSPATMPAAAGDQDLQPKERLFSVWRTQATRLHQP